MIIVNRTDNDKHWQESGATENNNKKKNVEQLKTTTPKERGEIENKTTKNVEKLEPSSITCRNVKWYNDNREFKKN